MCLHLFFKFDIVTPPPPIRYSDPSLGVSLYRESLYYLVLFTWKNKKQNETCAIYDEAEPRNGRN